MEKILCEKCSYTRIATKSLSLLHTGLQPRLPDTPIDCTRPYIHTRMQLHYTHTQVVLTQYTSIGLHHQKFRVHIVYIVVYIPTLTAIYTDTHITNSYVHTHNTNHIQRHLHPHSHMHSDPHKHLVIITSIYTSTHICIYTHTHICRHLYPPYLHQHTYNTHTHQYPHTHSPTSNPCQHPQTRLIIRIRIALKCFLYILSLMTLEYFKMVVCEITTVVCVLCLHCRNAM